MTPSRDYRDFVNDMVQACRSILRFVEEMTLDTTLRTKRPVTPLCAATRFSGRLSDIFPIP